MKKFSLFLTCLTFESNRENSEREIPIFSFLSTELLTIDFGVLINFNDLDIAVTRVELVEFGRLFFSDN